jgi:hypothetical protein
MPTAKQLTALLYALTAEKNKRMKAGTWMKDEETKTDKPEDAKKPVKKTGKKDSTGATPEPKKAEKTLKKVSALKGAKQNAQDAV